MRGRIYFPGNPWPEGHAVDELVWSARVDAERGLVFNLHLESARYYAERDIDGVDGVSVSDFESPGLWGNYHSCRLSSSFWHDGGWVVGTDEAPLVFAELASHVFTVDDPSSAEFDADDFDARAFHIYLLGHDDVADHRIHFRPQGAGQWSLDWRGRIALAYAGDYDFDYEFRVEARGLTFAGFELGTGQDVDDAMAMVTRWCRDPGELTVVIEPGVARYLRSSR